MEDSQPGTSVETDQVQRTVADCDRRLARHRAALEAGADPALVARWTRDVQSERAAALAQLQSSATRVARRLSQRVCGLQQADADNDLGAGSPADGAERAEPGPRTRGLRVRTVQCRIG